MVYVFDPNKGTFDQVLKIALDYPRNGTANWQPWTSDFGTTLNAHSPNLLNYPQPILSDIEFDPSGALLLGFMDRFGHQTGTDQPDPSGYGVYTGVAAGDVLRVAFDNPSQQPKNERQWQKRFVLEANASAGGLSTNGSNNQQGPAGGEFYNQDGFGWGKIDIHTENGSGGLALIDGQLLQSAHEPTEAFNTAGFTVFDTQTGKKTGGLALFQNLEAGRFIKGNGVGDIELIDDLPSTGAGNRVWLDANANGIQEPDEVAVGHVELLLYAADTLVAKTTTDSEGLYWFDAQNVTGGLLPQTDYQIRVKGGLEGRFQPYFVTVR
jgi:hypothetical protein